MPKLLTKLLLSCCLIPCLQANDSIAGGRTQAQSYYFEIYGGIGQISSISGSVDETRNGSLVSGGLNTELNDIGIDDGSETFLIGGKITGKWFTLLLDYRQNHIEASGTADSEIRLNVDEISFNGNSFEYLLIPVDSEYSVESETNLLGIGLRITPFTINPQGNVRFTPWIHGGFQYVDTTFDIDSGSTIDVEVGDFNERIYAVNGQASGSAQLLIPEIGIGGDLRFFFGSEENPSSELSIYGTYKILDLSGNLDSLGVEADEFDTLDVSYKALEIGANFYWPMTQTMDLLIGLYMEQIESDTTLGSKPSAGDFQREVNLDYTLYGLRAGARF